MNDLKNLIIAIVGGSILYFFIAIQYFSIPFSWTGLLFYIILAYPYKYGNSVISLFGGVNDTGNVYALLDLHSEGRNVYSLISISLLSNAKNISPQKKGNIKNIFGILLFPEADNQITSNVFGFYISPVSKGGIFISLGVNLFPVADGDIELLCGLVVSALTKRDTKGDVKVVLGAILFSQARNIIVMIGLLIGTKASSCNVLGFGIPLFNKGGLQTTTDFHRAFRFLRGIKIR